MIFFIHLILIMAKITERYKDEIIHISGGEIADTKTLKTYEVRNSTLIKRKGTNKLEFDYPSFFVLDTTKLFKLLSFEIKQVHLALLITISNNLKMGCNICLDENEEPLTAKKIGQLINNSEQATKKKLNVLVNSGLLYYGKITRSEFKSRVYVVNPHIIKRGRYFEKYLSSLFNDI